MHGRGSEFTAFACGPKYRSIFVAAQQKGNFCAVILLILSFGPGLR